ncbi:MAG TPA: hypothetical protein VGF82_09595 [Terracidiphilus sp.]
MRFDRQSAVARAVSAVALGAFGFGIVTALNAQKPAPSADDGTGKPEH